MISQLVVGGTVPRTQGQPRLPLKALDVGLHLARWEQHHSAAAQHHSVPAAKCPPGMVSGLTEIGGPCVRTQMRPQGLDDLLPRKAMAIGQRKKLPKLSGPPSRPSRVRHRPALHADSEDPQQLNAHVTASRADRH